MKKIKTFIKKHKAFSFYMLLAILCILTAAAAPLIAPCDPIETDFLATLQAPTREHLFGTDTLGRDVFSRVLYGARTSLQSTFILLAAVFFIGTGLGIIAGFCGGVIDGLIMRIADTMIAFPDLILAIAIAGILGPNLSNSMIAIAVVSWTKYARLARSLVLKIKNLDYIAAARVTGSKNLYMIRTYFIPNVLPTVIITASMDIGTIMLSLASLSFLGFGVQPPTPEWGYMLSEGRTYILTAPWLLIFPGLAILIVVSIFNLLGDSVRDLLDPNSQKRGGLYMRRRKQMKKRAERRKQTA